MNHPPIEEQNKPILTTGEAAYYLNRQPQTLREWACRKSGPLRPIHVNGRLGWPTEQVKCILKVGQFQ